MAHFIASKPSICMSQRNNLDVCPIRTLLKVVERDVSYGVTVQVFFFLINAVSSVGVEH